MSPLALSRWTAAALALCVLASRARCDDGVSVSVVAILATDKNDKINPGLEAIAKEIQKTQPQLTGFQIAVTSRKTIAVGGKDDFDLGNDQSLRVEVQQKLDKEDRYQIKLTPPKMGDITCHAACCGRFLPIITPFRTKNGEWLIVGVSLQPAGCKQGGGYPAPTAPSCQSPVRPG